MTQWGLDTLFNPAKRHMDEEKRRLQSTREQLGDSSGGKRIDLESGKVTIRRETAEGDESGDADETSAEASAETSAETSSPTGAETGAGTAAEAPAKKAKAEPSPAAVRAAARRGRQPR